MKETEVPLLKKRFLCLSGALEARVMAETERYLMIQHKGCYPFVVTKEVFYKLYEEIIQGE